MAENRIIATYLQEAWIGDAPDNYEFEDRHNGLLFLLQGNKKPENQKGSNRYGIGFILSPLAWRATSEKW